MEQRLTLHIVDGDSRSRAEQARIAFALGHHAEVYTDIAEFLDRPPNAGIILLRQRTMDVSLGELLEGLGELGVWLPVVVCADEPQLERVVDAIKTGALDYLQLPLEAGRLARSLSRVADEADAHGRARQSLADARQRIGMLSKREREVLELLSHGSSNKLIARELGISPRTVEIHRGNMMTKLRAGHAAEAVRLWLQSGLETTVPVPADEVWASESRGFVLQRDFRRKLRQWLPDTAEGEETRHDKAEPASRRARSG